MYFPSLACFILICGYLTLLVLGRPSNTTSVPNKEEISTDILSQGEQLNKTLSITQPTKHKPDQEKIGFDGLSFFVGILVSSGVIIVAYGCYRHYKRNKARLNQ